MKTKLLLLPALMLLAFGAQAQKENVNRYGQVLVKEGNGWKVQDWDKIKSRTGAKFSPDTVPGWSQPYKYVPDKIKPEDREKFDLENYIYKNYPSYSCRMDVYKPKGQGDGPFPWVMFIHGGGWTNGSERGMSVLASYFASNGIAAVSISYTLSGQGTFEDTRKDMSDAFAYVLKNAARWGFDPARYGFSGFSAGGHLSSYMAMTTPGTSVLVSIAGPHNLYLLGGADPNVAAAANPAGSPLLRYFGVKSKNTDSLREYSPYFLIPSDPAAIPAAMLIHGCLDMAVSVEQSIEFARELKAKGARNVELLAVPYAPHGVMNLRFNYQCEDNMIKALAFARKHFK